MNNEPVAWIINGRLSDEFYTTSELDVIIPLYTHPVKELTDKEIISIGEQYWNGAPFKFVDFARAILRKAQEK